MKDIFTSHYQTNYWRDAESLSGAGSNLKATEIIRHELPLLFKLLGVTSVLDIPCGDFYWYSQMRGLEGIQYIGADIVEPLLAENRMAYPKVDFRLIDATKDKLPKVDLIFCRDMLGHLPKRDVFAALRNFRASGSTWLLSTTFPKHETRYDILAGEWRPINLASMYGLPDPELLINEGCTGEFADKCLGLWRLDSVE